MNGRPVTWVLRLEGGAALAGAVVGYDALGASWVWFAVLFLAPDVSMLGYLANARLGAAVYNAGHTYLAPAALALGGWASDAPTLFPLALIWAAHIGFDRLLGYGLKSGLQFGDTHLGEVGARPPLTPAPRT